MAKLLTPARLIPFFLITYTKMPAHSREGKSETDARTPLKTVNTLVATSRCDGADNTNYSVQPRPVLAGGSQTELQRTLPAERQQSQRSTWLAEPHRDMQIHPLKEF